MGPLNLRSVQCFIAVAEELHFGRAAARLNMGQPPLSQHIRRLEADLGVALFQRSRRKVEMTAAGRAFLEEARLLSAQADRARMIARKADRGEIGQLSIGFVPSGNHGQLTDVLSCFRERYPDVDVDVQSLSTTAQLTALSEGRLQIGFIRMPVTATGLKIRVIWREPMVVALKQDDPLAKQSTINIAALAPHTLILFPRRLAPGFYDFILGLLLQARTRPTRIEEVEHMRPKLAMVAKGLGVAILPSGVTDFKHKGVVYRRVSTPRATVETAVAYRAETLNDVAKAFLQLIDMPGIQQRRQGGSRRKGI
jgi:DNA-binding transcriptional LysR family regulator